MKDNPHLTGKDARKFIDDNRNVKKATEEERVNILQSYANLKAIIKADTWRRKEVY